MTITFAFRKIEATEALKQHITKKAQKFDKYVTYPMEIHVVLSLDKPYQTAEVNCHAEHRTIVAIAKSKDLYESIDMAMHKVEGRLKKEREKKKGHKSAHLAARPAALKLARDVEADIPHREKKRRAVSAS